LINSRTEEAFQPLSANGVSDQITYIIDSLAKRIKDFLIVSELKKGTSIELEKNASSASPEAFKDFMRGNDALGNEDYETAEKWYLSALEKDSSFIDAAIMLSGTFYNRGRYDKAKELIKRIYKKREQVSDWLKISIEYANALYFAGPKESMRYTKQLLQMDDQQPTQHYILGFEYMSLNQYNNAIPEFEKALELYHQWGTKPWSFLMYTQLGDCYHQTGKDKKEKKLYKEAEQDFPDYPALIYNQAILAVSEGKTKEADNYINKYKSIRKDQLWSDAGINSSLASIYSESGILDKAEELYRTALGLEPDNPARLNALAYFLIDKDRNVDEGLEFVDKALQMNPDRYYLYLHTQGWGLYKQGKYQEALKLIQKSWDIRMDEAIYSHAAWLHLEEAKKAVQKLGAVQN